VRLPSRRQLTRFADVVIPWGVGLILILSAIDEYATPTSWLPLVATVALAAVQGALLHWRRARPVEVTALVLAAGLVYHPLVAEVVLPFAGFFAVGSLAAARPARISLLGLAGLLVLSATNVFTAPAGEVVFTIGLAIGAWALGDAARNRDLAIREATKRAASEEQARIAREMHDVIAHSVSVIVVQAAAADHVFEAKPEAARATLRAIEAAAREAQQELHRLLAASRDGGDSASAQPQPGLDRLEELAAPLRNAGLRIEVRRDGAPRELPAGVDRTAYRIVQEALTNTVRHARATRAYVTVRYSQDALELSVVDDGRGGTSLWDGGGYGLVGMRERAAMCGGTLEAGPLPGGGYRVHARLPLKAEQ
jgi:signal transduction histidine kinase